MATQSQIYAATDAPTEFEPFPIEQVVKGDIDGKVNFLRTTSNGEGQLYAGIFTCNTSVFRYEFTGDESFHVMEGEAEIVLAGGEQVTVKPGDIASFPKGAASTWTVKGPFKKFFVISG